MIMTARILSKQRRQRGRNPLIFYSFLIALLIGCGKEEENRSHAGFRINVVAYESKEQTISEKISLVGSLAANAAVEVKNEIDATIEGINFKEGESVEKGKMLFRFTQEKLKASLAQAEANLKLAEATAQRYQTLVQSRAVSQQEYDQAIATLEANRATVTLTREQLQDATIEAPFAGIMGERLVSIGQFITKGTSLSFLVNGDPMLIEFHVPERFLGKLRIGQSMEVRVAAYPGQLFIGEIYFIDPRINENTRTALVKAYTSNPKGQLRAGMFANVKVILDVRNDAIAIPESAIMLQQDDESIFVIDEENQVNSRLIQTGIRFDGMVEVIDGLAVGEKVVTEGHQKLRNGAMVVPRFDHQETQ